MVEESESGGSERPRDTKLRLGIMCLGRVLERWQVEAIEQMIATGTVELSLIIYDSPANYPTRSLCQKIREIGFTRALFQIYLRAVCRPTSRRPRDATQLFDLIPTITCTVERRGRWSQYFGLADLDSIRAANLDMILRFGFNIIRGEILTAARFGVWSFHHDDELRYRGGPPCFWEIYDQNPETGAILQRLTERLDGGVVLRKGVLRTKMHSYARNLDQAYLESAIWPAWVCRDIRNGTADYLDGEPARTTAPIYRQPTNRQFLKACLIMIKHALDGVAARYLRIQRWTVALIDLPIEAVVEEPQRIAQVSVDFLAPSSQKRFHADPFGIARDDSGIVLLEEIDPAARGRGTIKVSMVRRSTAGDWVVPSGLPDCHLSYPYLFEDAGEIYLIPETSALGKVTLYRAVPFPDRWAKVADLLEGHPFVDCTLIRRGSLYWLFYTLNGDGFDPDLHLHLACSERLSGPYRPHAANPVKSSARSARPAGTPFVDRRGRLIRPAQNFCRSYGGSTVFNEVTRLDEEVFAEREVGELLPFHPTFPDGLHTVSRFGERTLVDMKRHGWRGLP